MRVGGRSGVEGGLGVGGIESKGSSLRARGHCGQGGCKEGGDLAAM